MSPSAVSSLMLSCIMLKLKKQERKESYAIFRRSRVSSQFPLVVLRKSKEFDLVLRRQKGAEIQIHKRNTNVFLLESTWNIFKHKKVANFRQKNTQFFLVKKLTNVHFLSLKLIAKRQTIGDFHAFEKRKKVLQNILEK